MRCPAELLAGGCLLARHRKRRAAYRLCGSLCLDVGRSSLFLFLIVTCGICGVVWSGLAKASAAAPLAVLAARPGINLPFVHSKFIHSSAGPAFVRSSGSTVIFRIAGCGSFIGTGEGKAKCKSTVQAVVDWLGFLGQLCTPCALIGRVF